MRARVRTIGGIGQAGSGREGRPLQHEGEGRAAGWRVEIRSKPGAGTSIVAEVSIANYIGRERCRP